IWVPDSATLQLNQVEYVEQGGNAKYLHLAYLNPQVKNADGTPGTFMINLSPNQDAPHDPKDVLIKTSLRSWYKTTSSLPEYSNWTVYSTQIDANTLMVVAFPPGYPDQVNVLDSMMPISKKTGN
ncbi:MAG: hypothetical protein ACXVPK_12170, partial [Tumebacillaceae bacterium]